MQKEKEKGKEQPQKEVIQKGERFAIPKTLSDYNTDALPLDALIVVMGKRRYGKTTWVRWILSQIWWYFPSGGYVFTKTKHNHFWQQHFPENRIYVGINHDVLEAILQEQKDKYLAALKGQLTGSPWVIVVCDDVVSDSLVKHEDLLKTLAFEGRHYFMFVVFTTQDCKGLGVDVRTNTDLLAVTYQSSKRAYDTLKEEYADFFEDKHAFRNIVENNTSNFQLVVVDQSRPLCNVGNLNEIIFKSRADEKVEPFRIGTLLFWKQAGNNWMDQLEDHEHVPPKEREKWTQTIQEQWEYEENTELVQTPIRFVTNQIDFAPVEQREIAQEAYRRKMGLDKGSIIEQTIDRIPSLFEYRPH